MINTDLHIHSSHSSDGEYEVESIIDMCLERGIDTFSITDHDLVGACEQAQLLSSKKGIQFISGIEIDCTFEETNLHVLGYGVDWTSSDFRYLEEDISAKVMDSFSQMIENAKCLGFVIDQQAVLEKANGKLPTGELIAEVMLCDEKYHSPLLSPYIEGGNRSDMPYINFYLDYFAQGKSAYVPIEYMDYLKAIEMIKDNGGTAIVAHPGLNFKGREETVEKLLDKGAEGLEVFNNYHNAKQSAYFAQTVERRNAMMTCGSDFHGKTKPKISIGQFNLDRRYESYLKDSIQKIRNCP